MILDLRKFLETDGGIEPGKTVCPVFSRYDVSQGPMHAAPTITPITVLCIGELCGMWRRCQNLTGKPS